MLGCADFHTAFRLKDISGFTESALAIASDASGLADVLPKYLKLSDR